MAEVTELVFGTGNKAKIAQIQGALGDEYIVRGVNEFDVNIDVEEDGATAQENARKKAVAYARAIGRTVFAMDNALYFEGFDDADQPGLFVRRIGGEERSTDEEMVEAYTQLVSEHGDQLNGWWEFGLSIARPDGTSVETSIISPRIFTATPSTSRIEGYPLESMQIDPDSGVIVSEMTQEQQDEFWRKNIGEPLVRFVEENI